MQRQGGSMDAERVLRNRATRILLVENDARVRGAMRAMIDAAPGLSVCGEASTGADALRAAEELVPDVVILELLLPSPQDGMEVLALFVANGCRVVVLSLRGALRRAALDAGAITFIEKGASPDLILGALRHAPLAPPESST